MSRSTPVSFQKQPFRKCSASGAPDRLTSPQHMLTLGRDGDVCARKHCLGARVVHNLLHNLLNLIVVVRGGGRVIVLADDLRRDLVHIVDVYVAAGRQGRCQSWSIQVQ